MTQRIQYAIQIKGVGDPPVGAVRSEQIKFLRGNIPLKKIVVDHALVLDAQAKIEEHQTFWPVFFITTTPKILAELLNHPYVEGADPAGSFRIAQTSS